MLWFCFPFLTYAKSMVRRKLRIPSCKLNKDDTLLRNSFFWSWKKNSLWNQPYHQSHLIAKDQLTRSVILFLPPLGAGLADTGKMENIEITAHFDLVDIGKFSYG